MKVKNIILFSLGRKPLRRDIIKVRRALSRRELRVGISRVEHNMGK